MPSEPEICKAEVVLDFPRVRIKFRGEQQRFNRLCIVSVLAVERAEGRQSIRVGGIEQGLAACARLGQR